ncbi:MAG: DUF4834 family protein [Bacteroidia bacterium]|nr:DUF4834 family protein [Bacteroidia bacterium]NNC86183.1 hypothetical protein [Bacteroidia bacterium]
MGVGRILLLIAVGYLGYTIYKRYTSFISAAKNQQNFNRTQNHPQKPEGHITVEKVEDENTLDDDDFVDYEEVK